MAQGWIRRSGTAIVAAVSVVSFTAAAEAKVLDVDRFTVTVSGSQESSFTYSHTDPDGTGVSCVGSGTERIDFATPSPLRVRAALVKYRGTKRALWSFGKIAPSGLGDPNFSVPGQVSRSKQFQGAYSEGPGTCNFDGSPASCVVPSAPVNWDLALLGGASSLGTDASVILAGPTGETERPAARASTPVSCAAPFGTFSYPQFAGTASGPWVNLQRQVSADSVKRVFEDSVKKLGADGTYTLSETDPTTTAAAAAQARGEWHLDFKRVGKPD